MTTQEKWYIGGIVAVVVLVGGLIWFFSGPDSSNGESPVAGAAGNLLAEDYIPYVQYNDGYTSQNGITLIGADGVLVAPGVTTTNATITSNIRIGGVASTSGLKVGDEPNVSTINGLVFGFCSFADQSITASTTAFVHCTGATGLLTTDRVFVQATSSFDAAFVIQAASSTAADVISLRVVNTGLGVADGTLGGTSVNFWAVRP